MKRLLGTLSVCFVLIATLGIVSLAQAGQQPAPAAPAQGQAPSQTPVRTYEGELSKVDSTAKTITLKGSDSKEMTFAYDTTTEVTGVDGGAQGLGGKTGSSLKVSYRDERGTNRASKIEVQAKK